jgi:hypothetical protein
MHHDFSPPRTTAFQVMTLTDVEGKAPSRMYHFLLDHPITVPFYFSELHVNTLPTSRSSRRSISTHDPAGCFHADPDEKLLVFVLGSPNTEMSTTSFSQYTLHVLHVPHATFLSHIAAHRAAGACAPDGSVATATAAEPVVVVPWREWGPGRTHLTTMSNVSQRNLDEHRVCGMHALAEPHLLDRGILRITDYHPHRVVRARARAAAAAVGSGDDDPAATAAEAEEGRGGEEGSRRRPRGGSDCDRDHDTARSELPRGGGVQAQIPYVEKDIPLPEGLRSGYFRCILGEDVVVLLEVGHHFGYRSMTQHGTR